MYKNNIKNKSLVIKLYAIGNKNFNKSTFAFLKRFSFTIL